MSNKPIKVLTEEGLRILWNQISLDDYPNNDLLIAVLDGIDATKADKTEVADAKQEAIDAAAQDATDKDAIVLSEAQSYADDLNITYDEKIKGYIDNKDFYQIVNNPFIPISIIGTEANSGKRLIVDLNELMNNYSNGSICNFINDKTYSLVQFTQNDASLSFVKPDKLSVIINFSDTSSMITVYHNIGYTIFETSNSVTTVRKYLYGTVGDNGTVYQKTEVDELLTAKADAEHSHDGLYYTEAEVDELIETHTHSWDELTDKPFGEQQTNTFTITFTDSTTGILNITGEELANYNGLTTTAMINRCLYNVEIYGTEIANLLQSTINIKSSMIALSGQALSNSNTFTTVRIIENNTGEPAIATAGDVWTVVFNNNDVVSVRDTYLDENYIPDTIARVDDIPTNLSQLNNDIDAVCLETSQGEEAVILDEAINVPSPNVEVFGWDGYGFILPDNFMFSKDKVYSWNINNGSNVEEGQGILSIHYEDSLDIEYIGTFLRPETETTYAPMIIYTIGESGGGYYMCFNQPIDFNIQFSMSRFSKQISEEYIPDTIARTNDVVQSDWTETDETSMAFIKNKPFGESVSFIDVIPEQEVEFSNGSLSTYRLNVIDFEANKTYYLTVDGVTTSGVMNYQGNPVYDYFCNFDNGWYYEYGNIYTNNDFTGTATIQLQVGGVTINKIDEKYLPEMVGKKTAEGGEIFNLYEAQSSNMNNAGYYAHAEGYGTSAGGNYSHAEGIHAVASNDSSHAEGGGTSASGDCSHAEGKNTVASGIASHAEGRNTVASGIASHAEGSDTEAGGNYSHAEGSGTSASGDCSHAEGGGTSASGDCSHAEGNLTKASGIASHAEGNFTKANGNYSHAEGSDTEAGGNYSHAEGMNTVASGVCQHVYGKFNIPDIDDDGNALNRYIHIVGNGDYEPTTTYSNAHTLDWSGNAWYSGIIKLGGTSYDDAFEVALKSDIVQSDWTENDETASGYIKNRPFYEETVTTTTEIVLLDTVHDFSANSVAILTGDMSEVGTGNQVIVTVDGVDYTATVYYQGNPIYEYYLSDFSEGCPIDYEIMNGIVNPSGTLGSVSIKIVGVNSITKTETVIHIIDEKYLPTLVGKKTIENGEIFNDQENIASAYYSHAEGNNTSASNFAAHAEGVDTEASGDAAHAEGHETEASEYAAHAEGYHTEASEYAAHAEGELTHASGEASHAEGNNTSASNFASHAEGRGTIASGDTSHAEGRGTIAISDNQHVQGKYNIRDTENKYSHIIGNGADGNYRSNAHTIDWNGVGWFAGGLQVGGNGQDDGAENVATQSYVTSAVTSALASYYLKTETYTQEEVNALVSTIPKFAIQPVDALPTADISSTTVYLLTTGDESENLYTEYIYVNNTWEKLGTQKLDLSGYALKTELPTKLSNLENDALDYIILKSSTAGSVKRFKITIDDSGILTSTELTE